MRKILALFIGVSLAIISQAANTELMIEMNSGEIHSFNLMENPEIHFIESQLIVTVNGMDNSFQMDNIRQLFYAESAAAETILREDAIIFAEGSLTILNPEPNLIVSDLRGRIITKYSEFDGSSPVVINLESQIGTYVIVKNGNSIIKLFITR